MLGELDEGSGDRDSQWALTYGVRPSKATNEGKYIAARKMEPVVVFVYECSERYLHDRGFAGSYIYTEVLLLPHPASICDSHIRLMLLTWYIQSEQYLKSDTVIPVPGTRARAAYCLSLYSGKGGDISVFG